MGNDFWIVVQWWGTLFLVGAVAFPLTKRLFSSWFNLSDDDNSPFTNTVISFSTYKLHDDLYSKLAVSVR